MSGRGTATSPVAGLAEVRARDSPGPGLCPQHPGAGGHREGRGAGGPSRNVTSKSQYWPRRPGGAARLEASPGEAAPSPRDEVQLRGGLGGSPPPGQQLPALGTQTGRVELHVLGGLLTGREAQREGLDMVARAEDVS